MGSTYIYSGYQRLRWETNSFLNYIILTKETLRSMDIPRYSRSYLYLYLYLYLHPELKLFILDKHS